MNFLKKLLLCPPLKSFLLFFASRINPFCIKLINFYGAYDNYIKFVRQKSLIKDTVLHGPFKGMRYPAHMSVGSVLLPKLLGSYEHEISTLIETLCSKKYDAIVDIGCAEGYYAIGFGMRIPDARVYAYDTNAKALHLCRQMAELNKVNINLRGFCSKETLASLDLGKQSLVISDCEGYELQLFDDSIAGQLQHHDLLIETHAHSNMECSNILIERLSKTHHITCYESLDDFKKVCTYDFPELKSLTPEERFQLLREGRGYTQQWIFAKSNTSYQEPDKT